MSPDMGWSLTFAIARPAATLAGLVVDLYCDLDLIRSIVEFAFSSEGAPLAECNRSARADFTEPACRGRTDTRFPYHNIFARARAALSIRKSVRQAGACPTATRDQTHWAAPRGRSFHYGGRFENTGGCE